MKCKNIKVKTNVYKRLIGDVEFLFKNTFYSPSYALIKRDLQVKFKYLGPYAQKS